MHNPPSLAELQSWMKWIITDPRGVDAALMGGMPEDAFPRERYAEPKPYAFPWIESHGKLSPEARLSVYAEAYFARLLEAMGTFFPAVKRELGDESFARAVAGYLKVSPSRTPNIEEVGARFAAYLQEFCSVPYACELAELEWKMQEVFYARDARKLDASKIGESSILEVSGSVQVMRSRWNLVELQEGSEPPSERSEACAVLIWRDPRGVHCQELSRVEERLLSSIANGKPLSEACDGVEADDAEIVQRALSRWIQQEVIDQVCSS